MTKLFFARRVMVALLLLVLASALQADGRSDASAFSAAEAKLRQLAPSASTIAISETPVPGLLQAQIENEIVYISSDGKYLVQGALLDIDARVNLTDQARAGLRRTLFDGVENPREIVFSPEGEPDYSLVVFTDIDCGYCRKLHNEIDDYTAAGIEVRYMAFPRAGIGSPSYEKYVSVWCAEDQQAALTLAKNGSEPEPLQCDNPVLEQYEIGQQAGVTGTPAIITADGTLIPGYMPAQALRARLDALQAASSLQP